jgi:LCP family protein required for cell wall assembly
VKKKINRTSGAKHPRQTKSTVTVSVPSGKGRRRRARSKKKSNHKFNMKRYFQILAVALVAVIAVGAVCLGLNYGNSDDSALAPVTREDGRINVLLLGVDVEGLRTDAIMVASYDIKENNIDILSIPRDTRMYIGSTYQKINAAHAIGGMTGKIAGAEGTIEAVTRLTAIPIHYYIEFSFDAIDNFMNILGPVKFDVPDAEGNGRGMNYDDPAQNLHIHLKPGMQELKGNQVQQLLRYRKSSGSSQHKNGYDGSDTGRVSTQQAFIKELLKQKLNMSIIPKIPSIFSQMSKDIKTNLSLSDVTKYAKYLQDFAQAISNIDPAAGEGMSSLVSFNQLPGNYNGTDYGASYWICDLEATKTLVRENFGYDASNITIDSADGTSTSKNKKKNSKKSDSKSTSSPKPSSTTKPKSSSAPKTTVTPKPSSKPSVSPSVTPKASGEPKPTKTPSPTKIPESNNDIDSIDLDE